VLATKRDQDYDTEVTLIRQPLLDRATG
jgi:hypothetical protein